MSESEKSPRPKVELGTTPADAPAVAQKAAGAQGGAGQKAAGQGPAASGAPESTGFARVSAWVSKTFPGHENAFWGGALGLLAAVVLLAFGIFKTLVVVVLVVAGVALGQFVDGDPKLIRALQRLFSNNQ